MRISSSDLAARREVGGGAGPVVDAPRDAAGLEPPPNMPPEVPTVFVVPLPPPPLPPDPGSARPEGLDGSVGFAPPKRGAAAAGAGVVDDEDAGGLAPNMLGAADPDDAGAEVAAVSLGAVIPPNIGAAGDAGLGASSFLGPKRPPDSPGAGAEVAGVPVLDVPPKVKADFGA